jgi:hypothetical protein
MTDIRSILILLLLLPAISLAQTAHVEKENVLYKGKLEIHSSGSEELYHYAKNLLLNYVNPVPDSLKEKRNEKELTTSVSVRLPSSYHIIKTLNYKVKLQTKADEIEYEVDNIYLRIKERGRKEKIIPSEQLLKGMGESGKVAMEAEKQLNELDMHIQKLIASLQADSRKG